jgi:hypothetical protein
MNELSYLSCGVDGRSRVQGGFACYGSTRGGAERTNLTPFVPLMEPRGAYQGACMGNFGFRPEHVPFPKKSICDNSRWSVKDIRPPTDNALGRDRAID